MKPTRYWQYLSLLTILLLVTTVSLAQIQNGQIRGTVTDPQGAAVVGANVTVTNPATSESKSVITNNTGLFTLPEVLPGTYRITVDAAGFKKTTTQNVVVNAGSITHLDFKMAIGERTETIEVSDIATQVETEDSKLATMVTGKQIESLPLNGRNVYDLIQLAPGAVNVNGIVSENGHGTVVNGLREDFNGFLVNGVSNKGLSGGNVTTPVEDTVQEFQQLTLNMSAQYGNSAGSTTNLVTKSGTNNWHGGVWWFVRNDMFDANNFFNNATGAANPALHFNQFGGAVGGPILKDKLFFFASYQGDRFLTSNTPSTTQVEGPEWRSAVEAAQTAFGTSPVASLLYSTFAPSSQGTVNSDLNGWAIGTLGAPDAGGGVADMGSWLCPDTYANLAGDPTGVLHAQAMANIIGVTAADYTSANIFTGVACAAPLAAQAGTFTRTNPFMYDTVAVFKQRTQGNLFNGNEASLRLDWNASEKDHFFTQFNWQKTTDEFGAGLPSSGRGFTNPTKGVFPNFQFNWTRTFTPHVVNEFRAGYNGNILLVNTNDPGVPLIGFDTGSMGFGSYNGYPQFFKENIYTYGDMVSISKGKHNIKIGYDLRRNIENSEFNVGRPSYYFQDELMFSIDSPYTVAAGVDPCVAAGSTCTAHLQSNVRHWRNWEHGAFFQDDWKVSSRVTLNLGLRYDLYQRHTEENNLATTFLQGSNEPLIANITTGQGWLHDANALAGTPGCDTSLAQERLAQLAGTCGPGGFAPANSLGKGDHNDFGPRIGFAWDVFGNGKTSLRGGYGISYEGTLYNPLSNSRWNLPYYSFNSATNLLGGEAQNVPYGPQNVACGAPSFTGAPCPQNNQGTQGATAIGNIMAWDPTNPNFAILTGIVLPQGIRDPYVQNFFLSTQHELAPRMVLELDYVGTLGRKLFRAEDINRIPGGRLPEGTCAVDTFGRTVCSQLNSAPDPFTGLPVNSSGRLNGNYGTLRTWENSVSSNYNALQVSLRHQSWHGLSYNFNYTWSHSIDGGSTWHSGATTANGAAACEGYTLDVTQPWLCRGNSIYDIRHRIVANYVYEMPFFKGHGGFAEAAFGGWQVNGIFAFQTGAHWTPWCSRSAFQSTPCDFNKDGGNNDRPNALAPNVSATHDMWGYGWSTNGTNYDMQTGGTFFTAPCDPTQSCIGNEGRNTFVGPRQVYTDFSLFKTFRITERTRLQFRWETFNLFNHTNFLLPGSNGATHNRVTSSSFGKAGGTLNPRQMQFGLKLNF